jgi:hypothetical protein
MAFWGEVSIDSTLELDTAIILLKRLLYGVVYRLCSKPYTYTVKVE